MKPTKKTFQVEASETVIYQFTVEAENEEEARDIVMSGEVEIGDATDSDGFQIDEVTQLL